MGTSRATVEVEVDLVTIETDDAILCLIKGEEHWIPKSQIDESSEVQGKNDEGTLVVAEWIAIKKGIV